MSEPLHKLDIHLRDLGSSLVDAWREAFRDIPSVTVSRGDIFSTKEGPINNREPIDIKADAIVSPANSFGFMNGGIDALYTYQFGPGLQQRLQALLVERFGAELPIGMAVIVPTGSPDIPWCISAPTMRIPRGVADTLNAYLAFRAALRAVLAHNASGLPPIRSILCPGLGTAVGQMPVERCARQMRAAWDQVLGAEPALPTSLGAATALELELLR